MVATVAECYIKSNDHGFERGLVFYKSFYIVIEPLIDRNYQEGIHKKTLNSSKRCRQKNGKQATRFHINILRRAASGR